MATHPYTPPALDLTEYHCPHCRAFATQGWQSPHRQPTFKHGPVNFGTDSNFKISMCGHCEKMCVWIGPRMVFPTATSAPHPNPDLPDDIQADYNEARDILGTSPRAAAALLRLCVQKLCKHLGQPGKNINADIGALVQNGLPEMVQQSLDIVRVVGNNSVHPGQLDMRDDQQTASQLFDLVNIVADIMISQPKKVSSLYSSVVPKGQQDAIAKRDAK